jgi:hypothetical protein
MLSLRRAVRLSSSSSSAKDNRFTGDILDAISSSSSPVATKTSYSGKESVSTILDSRKKIQLNAEYNNSTRIDIGILSFSYRVIRKVVFHFRDTQDI